MHAVAVAVADAGAEPVLGTQKQTIFSLISSGAGNSMRSMEPSPQSPSGSIQRDGRFSNCASRSC